MADLTEEQQRALEYQRQDRRRAAATRARERALAGDRQAAAEVRDAWRPLTKDPADTSVP
jgi:hypothetical protein